MTNEAAEMPEQQTLSKTQDVPLAGRQCHEPSNGHSKRMSNTAVCGLMLTSASSHEQTDSALGAFGSMPCVSFL